MSMPRAVRHINEARALSALLKRGPMSRADLARDLGVTRATASSIVGSLMGSGYVADGPVQDEADRQRRTGRPSTLVSLRPGHAVFLGAGIAVDHVAFAAIDLGASPIFSTSVPFDCAGNDYGAVARFVAETVLDLATAAIGDMRSVQGLGVAVPGPVDFHGNVMRAPLLGWRNVPLMRAVPDHLPGIPVAHLDNDANAFAIADVNRNGRPEKLDAIYLFIEDGVGGCIMHDGAILRGSHGCGGELGHIIVGETGYMPAPTIEGSLESFVARPALLARHGWYGGKAASIPALLEALGNGEPAARRAVDDWAHFLGRGLSTLVSAIDPEIVIIGGEVASVFPFARDVVEGSMRKHLLEDSQSVAIELTPMGVEASAYGVALIQHKQFFALDREVVFGASPT
jgi:predicted NBD/HSP70 family sugar kinase